MHLNCLRVLCWSPKHSIFFPKLIGSNEAWPDFANAPTALNLDILSLSSRKHYFDFRCIPKHFVHSKRYTNMTTGSLVNSQRKGRKIVKCFK